MGFAEGFIVGFREGGNTPSISRISGTGFVVGSFIVWVIMVKKTEISLCAFQHKTKLTLVGILVGTLVGFFDGRRVGLLVGTEEDDSASLPP